MVGHSAFSKSNISNDECHVETVVVKEGDTLWSIASEYKPKGKNLSEFVYEIADNNGISDCNIVCGQTLYVPSMK